MTQDGSIGGSVPQLAIDLTAYREAVDALVTDVGAGGLEVQRHRVTQLLDRSRVAPEIARALEFAPGGAGRAMDSMSREITDYQPNARSAADDLPSLVRILLLAQIDAIWWGHVPAYRTTETVDSTTELVDVRSGRNGRAPVRCRVQPRTRTHRLARAVERRIVPDRTPRTAGVVSPRTRPEVNTLLGEISADFHRIVPSGTPPLWVTSMTRSIEHQQHLRSLGYSAVLPSAHCTGHAVDLEMRWFERFGVGDVLAEVLWAHQDEGRVNVINEGQAWHVCISPDALAGLRTHGATGTED
ncbi:DUF5715 family protein [Janibacter alittae]|uniref:DUF5715 family protein n=1 Tax=Janibacter alittae TaxID=3115209 RepID=A0ABZ2MDZ9_9MICO